MCFRLSRVEIVRTASCHNHKCFTKLGVCKIYKCLMANKWSTWKDKKKETKRTHLIIHLVMKGLQINGIMFQEGMKFRMIVSKMMETVKTRMIKLKISISFLIPKSKNSLPKIKITTLINSCNLLTWMNKQPQNLLLFHFKSLLIQYCKINKVKAACTTIIFGQAIQFKILQNVNKWVYCLKTKKWIQRKPLKKAKNIFKMMIKVQETQKLDHQ